MRTPVVFFPQTPKPCLKVKNNNNEKTSHKYKLRDILQNIGEVFFKTVKVMKNKGRLRNYHRPEETKEN